MKNKFGFIFLLYSVSLIAYRISLVTAVNAATISATSCSYTDIANAVAAASTGDTVLVPAGSSTWSSSLTISKGIYLIGAGIGNT